MQTTEQLIQQLSLQPHPEGGYFKETGHSPHTLTTIHGTKRYYYTNILFLLTANNPSHFHRLKSDEVWYYHSGAPLSVHCIFPTGEYQEIILGNDFTNGQVLQYTVPADTIFASSVNENHALVSCMVSPGFDYTDFELFTQHDLLVEYPQHQTVIEKYAFEVLP